MRARFFLLTALSLMLTLPSSNVWAQVCSGAFVSAVSSVEMIKNFSGKDNSYLAIIDSDNHKDALKVRTAIKEILKNKSGTCDFSSIKVAIADKNFKRIDRGFPAPVKDSDFEELLYEYVYSLDPVDVDTNLKGYEALIALNPANGYYKARLEHYKSRKELYIARKEFINEALREAARNKSIADIKLNREFCLLVTATGDPMSTANAFMAKVLQKVPSLTKQPCLFVYGPDLKKAGENCPEWADSEKAKQSEIILLQAYVKGLPSFELTKNLDGYKKLSEMLPDSLLYKSKVKLYSAKISALKNFSTIKTASGAPFFKSSDRKGYLYQVELSDKAVDGLSKTGLNSLYHTLTSLYEYNGAALNQCEIIKEGQKVGIISCNKSGQCLFKTTN